MLSISKDTAVNDYLNTLVSVAEQSSRSTFGEVTSSFVLGYVLSDLQFMLDSLSLSKKQLKILKARHDQV
jgi:hypothetical protein